MAPSLKFREDEMMSKQALQAPHTVPLPPYGASLIWSSSCMDPRGACEAYFSADSFLPGR